MIRNFKLHTTLAYEVYWFKKECEICKSLEKIYVHHKDENPWNNTKENLQILCRSCHQYLHMKWKQYALWYKHNINAIKKISNANIWNKKMFWKKHTEQTKIKISKKMIWIKKTDITKKKLSIINSKKVNQYDLDWNFIKTWESALLAKKNWIKWHIWEVCNWKRKNAWWFIWKYFNF